MTPGGKAWRPGHFPDFHILRALDHHSYPYAFGMDKSYILLTDAVRSSSNLQQEEARLRAALCASLERLMALFQAWEAQCLHHPSALLSGHRHPDSSAVGVTVPLPFTDTRVAPLPQTPRLRS